MRFKEEEESQGVREGTYPTRCLCGARVEGGTDFWGIKDSVSLVRCSVCGVGRVGKINPVEYWGFYESGEFHGKHQREINHPPFGGEEKWKDDLRVAELRLDKLMGVERDRNREKAGRNGRTRTSSLSPLEYSSSLLESPLPPLPPNSYPLRLLDIGCGTGAFVLASLERGYVATGCDLFVGSVREEVKTRVRKGTIEDFCNHFSSFYNVITMHDVIEHLLYPQIALRAARHLLREDGLLVLELPNMGSDLAKKEGLNFHSIWVKEHIWYFTEEQLRTVVEKERFQVLAVDYPIPGKMTLYCECEPTRE